MLQTQSLGHPWQTRASAGLPEHRGPCLSHQLCVDLLSSCSVVESVVLLESERWQQQVGLWTPQFLKPPSFSWSESQIWNVKTQWDVSVSCLLVRWQNPRFRRIFTQEDSCAGCIYVWNYHSTTCQNEFCTLFSSNHLSVSGFYFPPPIYIYHPECVSSFRFILDRFCLDSFFMLSLNYRNNENKILNSFVNCSKICIKVQF